MKLNNIIIRIALITFFMILAISSLYAIIISNTVDLTNDSKLEMQIEERVFLIIFSLFTLISCIGLFLKKNFGIYLGYAIPPLIFIMFLLELRTHSLEEISKFNFTDIIWSLLFLASPILVFIWLRKLHDSSP